MAKRTDNLDWFDINETNLPRRIEAQRKASQAAYQAYKASRDEYHKMLVDAFTAAGKVPEGEELVIARTGFGKLRGAFRVPQASTAKAKGEALSLD